MSAIDPKTQATAALNLRPLSLGELLDRAFHLYFGNIIAFSSLLAVVLIPSVIVTYFQSRDIIGFYISTVQRVFTAPNSQPDLSKLQSLTPSDTLTGLQLFIALVLVPIAYGAVVVGVSRAYVGLPVKFADSYRQALRRWLPIVILIILWFIILVLAFVAFAIVFVISSAVMIPTVAILSRALGGATIVSILLALLFIALLLAGVGLIIMLYLTSAISFISVVLERIDPVQALSGAFARVFGGKQFWRGFALAIALTGIYFGASLVLGGGGAVLAFVLKAPALYFIFAAMLQLFFVPFAVVTASVYYYDIRIRREGYDLQMLIERFATPPPSSSSPA